LVPAPLLRVLLVSVVNREFFNELGLRQLIGP